MGTVHRRAIFRDRFQGVGFRSTTNRLATGNSILGYAKNLADGSVEVASVESTPGDLKSMILDGRDLGPLTVDIPTTIDGPDRLRRRVLVRRVGGGPPS